MSLTWIYFVTMPDGSVWSVPVAAIAGDRAAYYADEFGGDVQRSLAEDTIPLFEADSFEIKDWARNNMNWDDVKHCAEKVRDRASLTAAEFQNGWVNGEHEVRK